MLVALVGDDNNNKGGMYFYKDGIYRKELLSLKYRNKCFPVGVIDFCMSSISHNGGL
jgi:hypothetical protein